MVSVDYYQLRIITNTTLRRGCLCRQPFFLLIQTALLLIILQVVGVEEAITLIIQTAQLHILLRVVGVQETITLIIQTVQLHILLRVLGVEEAIILIIPTARSEVPCKAYSVASSGVPVAADHIYQEVKKSLQKHYTTQTAR